MGKTGDLRILLCHALVGVDEDQAHVRPVDSCDGAHIGVFLDSVVHLGLAAHARRVNKAVFAELIFKIAVDGIPGGPGHVGNDDPFLSKDLIEQAGFAYIGLSDDGHVDDLALRLLLGFLGEMGHTPVQQVAGAVAVDGGGLNGVAQTQHIEFVNVGIGSAHAVTLVDRQADRLFAPQEHVCHIHIRRRHAGLYVRHHDDDVRRLNGDLRLAAHEFQHFAVGVRLDAAGIDDLKLPSVPIAVAVDTVAGHAGRVLHNGGTSAGQLIKEHGFSHVGSADDGNQRLGHVPASFQKFLTVYYCTNRREFQP